MNQIDIDTLGYNLAEETEDEHEILEDADLTDPDFNEGEDETV